MERKNANNIYDGPQEGLFGKTDRSSGEYHFRNGGVQRIYSDAHYIPASENNAPPRYYHTPESSKPGKRKRGIGFFAVLTLCLACAIVGGVIGATVMSSYFNQRVDSLEENIKSISTESESAAAGLPNDDVLLMESEAANMELEDTADVSSSAAKKSIAATTVSTDYTAAEIYEIACRQSVVVTTEYSYQGETSRMPSVVSGSGIVLSSDGIILTNLHVVEKAVKGGYGPTVTFSNGDRFDSAVIGYDKSKDIALLKINAHDLEPATFGDSDLLNVGDVIYAVGDPYGVLEFSMTTGHVCALNRMVATEANEEGINMFQIDAAVYSGNSGGPVYNGNGEVVGIVTAKYGDGELDGVGFAIPVNDIAENISKMMSNAGNTTVKIRQRASLGISFDERYTSVYSRYYRMPEGAYVRSVDYGSCAYYAGLEPGDIIMQIGDFRIIGFGDVEPVLENFAAGDEAEIVLYRLGGYYTTDVVFDAEEG